MMAWKHAQGGDCRNAAAGRPNFSHMKYGVRLFRVAALDHDITAQLKLANCLECGKGTEEPQLSEALYWYQQAGAAGSTHACRKVAVMLQRGLGAVADSAEAERWQQAATKMKEVKAATAN